MRSPLSRHQTPAWAPPRPSLEVGGLGGAAEGTLQPPHRSRFSAETHKDPGAAGQRRAPRHRPATPRRSPRSQQQGWGTCPHLHAASPCPRVPVSPPQVPSCPLRPLGPAALGADAKGWLQRKQTQTQRRLLHPPQTASTGQWKTREGGGGRGYSFFHFCI